MESRQAVTIFSALAHENRLALFRLLVGASEAGLAAGALAEAVGVAPSTLSHHLALLEQSGLIQSRRESRHIYYSMVVPQVRSLLSFLVNDCCNGQPDLCGIGQPPC
jgi:DNA-binding transcriptional ArsR family regulator